MPALKVLFWCRIFSNGVEVYNYLRKRNFSI
nr:MAG TPA: hypothetical protein [Caudoviricetes sp.]